MSIFDRLGFKAAPLPPTVAAPPKPVVTEPPPDEGFPSLKALTGRPVGHSRDFERVDALPRRPRPDDAAMAALQDKWTSALAKPPGPCACRAHWKRACVNRLNAVQAWAFEEMASVGGLLGPIGVGFGKTLLDLLSPIVMGSKTAVLLIPPSLKNQLKVEWDFYAQHWRLPNLADSRFFDPRLPMLHVVSYSEISTAKNSTLLDTLRPDLVVLDEAHSVRNRTAARTKRVARYLAAHEECRVLAWSGTLVAKSLKDYAALSSAALGEGSPAPLDWPTVEEWAGALDPSDFPAPPGYLKRWGKPGERVIEGFSRRLTETRGVVSSSNADSCDASLVFDERKVEAPKVIVDKYADVIRLWERPDGEVLVDALSVGRCARELSAGFFNRWRYPRQEAKEVREAWLAAPKAWHKELREKLKLSRPHMDSPLLCYVAARNWHRGYTHDGKLYPPHTKSGPRPVFDAATWEEWDKLKDTCQPETEAVWVDDYLVLDAAKWMETGPGIVWVSNPAFGKKLSEASGRRYFGAGAKDSVDIIKCDGKEPIIASIDSHGTGKNLQAFNRNLIVAPPSGGGEWEQLVGRTHRQGQLADEVIVTVYRHMPAMAEAIDKARELAQFIQDSFNGSQKLVRATYLW